MWCDATNCNKSCLLFRKPRFIQDNNTCLKLGIEPMEQEITMNKRKETYDNSVLYARIKEIPMTVVQRRAALSALRDSEAVAGMILWIGNAIKQLFAGGALKPSLKH
jgi:hypothetical protein